MNKLEVRLTHELLEPLRLMKLVRDLGLLQSTQKKVVNRTFNRIKVLVDKKYTRKEILNLLRKDMELGENN